MRKRFSMIIPCAALAFLCVACAVNAQEVGGYPTAQPLNGNERILADQSGNTVNILPSQITTYLESSGAIISLLPSLVNGDCLSNNGTALLWSSCGSAGSGTVTSVSLTVPSGLSVSGSPITVAGTLAITTSLSGIILGTGSGFSIANASSVISLWTGMCNSTTFLRADGTCQTAGGGGGGSVTSVSLTAPTWLTVMGSPITTSGTIALTGTSQNANEVLASPNGTAGAPSFRALVSADIPTTLNSLTSASALATVGTITTGLWEGSAVTPLYGGTGVAGGLTGLVRANGSNAYSAATYTDVTALWSGTCSSTTYLRGDGSCSTPPGAGTVTSVALTAPSVFAVSGSPVTGAGTLAVTFATGQTANEFLATPSGASGAVGLRAIVAADLPASITSNTTGTAATITGALALANTPLTTLGDLLYVNATPALARLAGYTAANTAVLTQTGTGSVSAAPIWSNSPAINLANATGLPNGGLVNSSVTFNGQAVALGASGNVNAGAAQYSIALNGAAGAAIGGIALPGSTGTYCLDYASLTANPSLSNCPTGPAFQTNGTANASQTTLNIENGPGIAATNPSAGNVQVATTQAVSLIPLAPPVQSAATTSTTGGTLAAATYYYVIEATSASGNSSASNEESVTTTGTTSSNVLTWAAVTGATGYDVYRGTSAGAENVYYAVGNVTTYTDTNATSPSGSPHGAAYTIQSTDAAKLLECSNASAVSITLPQAGTNGFTGGFAFTLQATAGNAYCTVTPTTSTIDTLTALVVQPNTFAAITVDAGGSNYTAVGTAIEHIIVALGSQTSITPNCLGAVNTVTVTGAGTVNLPTCASPYDGQKITLILQSSAAETLSWNAGYLTGTTTGSAPASTTGSSDDDWVLLQYDGYYGTPGWVVQAINLGVH